MELNSVLYRYTALVQLWAHHNTTQLQWPVVIVGVVLVGLATLSAPMLGAIVRTETWGIETPVRLLGACYIVAALGMAAMIHTMSRARLIMRELEAELDRLEEHFGLAHPFLCFSMLNHPLRGFSGPQVLRLYVSGFLATPIAIAGAFLLFGWYWGAVSSVVTLACTASSMRAIARMTFRRRISKPGAHTAPKPGVVEEHVHTSQPSAGAEEH